MTFIMVYYIEFPIIIRGFPNEIHYFVASRRKSLAALDRTTRQEYLASLLALQ